MSLKCSILVLSDGKPGHYNQSFGIMDRMEDVSTEIIEIRFKRKWRDNLLRVFARLLAGVRLPHKLIRWMLRWSMEGASAERVLAGRHFDAILSTGSSVAAPNLLLGQLMDAKTAVCTRPSPVGDQRHSGLTAETTPTSTPHSPVTSRLPRTVGWE